MDGKSNNNLSRYNDIMNVRINNENLHTRQADVIVNWEMGPCAHGRAIYTSVS